jgi:xylitol oxidase
MVRLVSLTNWGRNYTYRAQAVHRPRTLEALQELVSSTEQVRVMGTRHAFTDIGDAETLISLAEMAPAVEIDAVARTVTVAAGLRYGDLAGELHRQGWGLANLASLPHISIGGAVATATHGSGSANGNLAAAVAALSLVRSDGELVSLRRGERDFEGAVVHLGALGAVTEVTLDIEPTYEVSQHVFEGLSWVALFEHFDAVLDAAYSVSVFSRWGASIEQVWVKARTGESAPVQLFGATPATVQRHPILGLDPVNCTPQLGTPGPWMERLPHFRLGFTPSAGDEIQSEYHLPRARAIESIEAMLGLAGDLRPLVQVAEIRAIAADALWMSPQYGRETIAIHFTWVPDEPAVTAALAKVEAALLPLGARPHWGKLFLAEAGELAPRYERASEFAALAARLDPRGAFVNPWLERVLLGAL